MSNDEKEQQAALVPVEEKQIDFYGDEITAAMIEVKGRSEVYVPIRPLCDYLGLSWAGQRERINRDPVMSEEMRFVRVTRTNLGGNPNLMALPLKYLPGWLFGINASRVKTELKQKIIRYQKECFEVLWQAFQGEVFAFAVVEQSQTPANNSQTVQSLLQIREMGIAITHMAEAQLELERRVGSTEARMNQAAQVVRQIQQRLGAVERATLPGAIISEAQAANVLSAVKTLGEFMTSKEPGKNHFQGIFMELFRRFRVSEYHHIRQSDYRDVLDFLADWSRSAGAGPAPEQGLLEL